MFRLIFLCLIVQSLKYEAVYNNGTPSRVKRVISGTPVLDLNSEYKSVRYFVWMSSSHNCDDISTEQVKRLVEIEGKSNRAFTVPFTACAPNSQRNVCGGSLLTSTIVQTACHCVAKFEGVRDGFRDAVTLRIWEDMYNIYPGVKPVQDAKGVRAKKYISHPKCTQPQNRTRPFHDYAVMVLRSPLNARGSTYAPVYTIPALTNIWTEIMAKNLVCLNVGFGRYRLLNNNESDPAKPQVLLHGWVRVLDYIECYHKTYTSTHSFIGWSFNWSDATWFCTLPLPRTTEHAGKGDSGGPVTCNNQYAGIVSYSSFRSPYYAFSYSASSSTAFSIVENSVEYREALNILVSLYDEYDGKAKVFKYKPTSPQISQYFGILSNIQARSSSAYNSLIVLVVTLFFIIRTTLFIKIY